MKTSDQMREERVEEYARIIGCVTSTLCHLGGLLERETAPRYLEAKKEIRARLTEIYKAFPTLQKYDHDQEIASRGDKS